MSAIDIIVLLIGTGLVAVLAWFFFAPRQAARARLEGETQVVDVRVKGGYSPNLIRVRAGKPVQLRFDRQENSDCTARVVFPDFRLSKSLPPFRTTTVGLQPSEPGEYGFACGMNMLHGTLVVDPDDADRAGVRDLEARVQDAQATDAAPTGMGKQARRDADGVSESNHETAWAVGVGPRLDGQSTYERIEFTLPGALRTLPTKTAWAEAQLRAIGDVDSAEVNFGTERVVVTYDPSLLSGESLAQAVRDVTGYDARERSAPG